MFANIVAHGLLNMLMVLFSMPHTLQPAVTDYLSALQGQSFTADAQRMAARNRRRRIILNNDGGEPTIEMKSATKQAFLECRTRSLQGTQVDSIFYCSRSSGFGVFTHFTRIGQIFTCTEGRYSGNQMTALLQAGLDPLQMQVEFGHAHGMEVFWSMRMNDTHDGSKTDYGPILFRDNKLKNAHPEWLMGTLAKPPKHGTWSAINYAIPEVRDLAFRYIEEVCQKYDVDGIELDFFRHPVFFKSTSQGRPATEEELQMLTSLLIKVRAMVEIEGKRRGRPLLIAIKLPDSAEYCRAIGLDLEAWLKQGLVDLLIPGGYFQIHDWTKTIELGHRYQVKVYPSLDESRLKDTGANQARQSSSGYRGRAAEAWSAGADGIYLFNFFKPSSSLLNELGSTEELSSRERYYFASPRGLGKAAGGNLPYEKYLTLETLNPGNPKALVPAKPVSSLLRTGTLGLNTASSMRTLRVRVKNVSAEHAPQLTLNGQSLTSSFKDNWIEADIPPAMQLTDCNKVVVTPGTKTQASAQWLDLVLEVRQRKH